MQAELVLLLPEQDSRKRSRGSVYTVILHDEDSEKQHNLFASFLRKANAWKHKRCAPQLREILLLLDRAHSLGTKEFAFRSEGKAFALPLQRKGEWVDDLPSDLQGSAESLSGLDALRLYCCICSGNLILFDGNVKCKNTVAEEGSNVQAEFNQATRLTLILEELSKSGKLRNTAQTGRLDLNHLGRFEVKTERT
ncbi:MAG: hypothetical protein AB8F78_09175 [Saprospiraceae bacterium]